MKTFILLFFSLSINAAVLDPNGQLVGCKNPITLSEAQNAIALEPNAGTTACSELEQCLCYDGIDWRAAVLVDDGRGVFIIQNDAGQLATVQAADQTKVTADSTRRSSLSTLKTDIQALPTSPEREALIKLIDIRLAQ
jgi:hypothetical protein